MWLQHDAELLYGCDQDWYTIEWRRRAGCGPVAATNILLYLSKKHDIKAIPYQNNNKDDAIIAMNDVYQYVKPRRRGLHTVKKFVKGMYKFGRRYGVRFWHQYILVPPQAQIRPDLSMVVSFLEEALNKDVPVVFLNLDAGEVEDQLQSWHWVTVVGMIKNNQVSDSASDSNGAVMLRYYDQSKCIDVDIGKWLDTTVKGGGFAYFCEPSLKQTGS